LVENIQYSAEPAAKTPNMCQTNESFRAAMAMVNALGNDGSLFCIKSWQHGGAAIPRLCELHGVACDQLAVASAD
jgi:hypothetical protein